MTWDIWKITYGSSEKDYTSNPYGYWYSIYERGYESRDEAKARAEELAASVQYLYGFIIKESESD